MPEDRLEAVKASFEPLTAEHVYSLASSDKVSNADMSNLSQQQDAQLFAQLKTSPNCLIDNRWANIKCSAALAPKLGKPSSRGTPGAASTSDAPSASTSTPLAKTPPSESLTSAPRTAAPVADQAALAAGAGGEKGKVPETKKESKKRPAPSSGGVAALFAKKPSPAEAKEAGSTTPPPAAAPAVASKATKPAATKGLEDEMAPKKSSKKRAVVSDDSEEEEAAASASKPAPVAAPKPAKKAAEAAKKPTAPAAKPASKPKQSLFGSATIKSKPTTGERATPPSSQEEDAPELEPSAAAKGEAAEEATLPSEVRGMETEAAAEVEALPSTKKERKKAKISPGSSLAEKPPKAAAQADEAQPKSPTGLEEEAAPVSEAAPMEAETLPPVAAPSGSRMRIVKVGTSHGGRHAATCARANVFSAPPPQRTSHPPSHPMPAYSGMPVFRSACVRSAPIWMTGATWCARRCGSRRRWSARCRLRLPCARLCLPPQRQQLPPRPRASPRS